MLDTPLWGIRMGSCEAAKAELTNRDGGVVTCRRWRGLSQLLVDFTVKCCRLLTVTICLFICIRITQFLISLHLPLCPWPHVDFSSLICVLVYLTACLSATLNLHVLFFKLFLHLVLLLKLFFLDLSHLIYNQRKDLLKKVESYFLPFFFIF